MPSHRRRLGDGDIRQTGLIDGLARYASFNPCTRGKFSFNIVRSCCWKACMRDPYAVLGVKRTAPPDEIKAAWRRLAKSFHPDRNQNDPGAGARFAELGQAYQLLKDPQRRYRYDMEQRLAAERKRQSAGRQSGKSDTRTERPRDPVKKNAAEAGGAGETFAGIFRKFTTPPPKPEKAPDLAADAWLSIEDIFSRYNPRAELPDGRTVKVPLPKAATEGTTVRVPAQGHKLPGMQRGDVVATLRIKPHDLFRVDGYDLHVDLPVDIENAVLGCETIVDTPAGPKRITVPEWTGSDKTIVMKGYGLPKEDGARGNLYAQVRVMLWDHPDDKVKDLMRSLREGLFL